MGVKNIWHNQKASRRALALYSLLVFSAKSVAPSYRPLSGTTYPLRLTVNPQYICQCGTFFSPFLIPSRATFNDIRIFRFLRLFIHLKIFSRNTFFFAFSTIPANSCSMRFFHTFSIISENIVREHSSIKLSKTWEENKIFSIDSSCTLILVFLVLSLTYIINYVNMFSTISIEL